MGRRKKYLIVLVAAVLLVAATQWVRLYFGLTHAGQEFGTFGQYNRVLRLVREMDGYEVANSRLSRRLDWKNLGHLDRFSVGIRDAQGRTATIEFVRDSDEMEESDPKALAAIIKRKFSEQIAVLNSKEPRPSP